MNAGLLRSSFVGSVPFAWGIFFLGLCAWMSGGSDAEPRRRASRPAGSGDAPVHVWVYSHHYVGGGGTYPTARHVREIAEVVREVKIPVTFFLDGILVEELQRQDPSLLPDLAAHPYLSFGYHGEETHGPYPIPTDLLGGVRRSPPLDLTHGKTWDDAFAAVADFARFARSYRLTPEIATGAMRLDRRFGGEIDPGRAGGVRLVEDTLARHGASLTIATYAGTQGAPVQAAFQSVVPVPVVQAGVPVAAHALRAPPALQERIFALGGTGDVFSYMGTLNTKKGPDAELSTRLAWSEARAVLQSLDRTRSRFLHYGLIATPDSVTGGIDRSALREHLERLRDDLVSRGPGWAFVTPGELTRLARTTDLSAVTGDPLDTMAVELTRTGERGSLPDWLAIPGGACSLADAFELLAGALAARHYTGRLPPSVAASGLLGPIATPADLPRGGGFSTAAGEIVAAAAAALERTRNGTPSRPRAVPAAVDLAGRAVNPAELLVAMARTWRHFRAGGAPADSIPVSAVNPLPPYAGVLAAVFRVDPASTPLGYTQLQLWTVKPAALEGS